MGGGDFSADGQYGEYTDGQFTDGQYQQEGEANAQTNEAAQNGSDAKTNEDERKLFVGGISWDTDNKDLREYFSKFGVVVDVNIKTDPTTGKSRGFGFVTFNAKDAIEAVLKATPHTVKGKQIDPKPAKARPGIKKIFVGGLESDMPEADIKAYFEKYGPVENVELPFDKAKNQRRQFAFVTFEREDSVELACVVDGVAAVVSAPALVHVVGVEAEAAVDEVEASRTRAGATKEAMEVAATAAAEAMARVMVAAMAKDTVVAMVTTTMAVAMAEATTTPGGTMAAARGGYGSGYGQQQSNYNKTRRGGGGAGGGGYHPYSR
ncbi:hypothetical protein MRX96_034806 [Rhipicephalus microplus]